MSKLAIKQTKVFKPMFEIKSCFFFFLATTGHNRAVVCIYCELLWCCLGISLVLGFVELFRQLRVLIVSYLKSAFYFTSSYIQFNSVSSKHVYSLEAKYVRLSVIWWSSSRLHTVLMLIPVLWPTESTTAIHLFWSPCKTSCCGGAAALLDRRHGGPAF